MRDKHGKNEKKKKKKKKKNLQLLPFNMFAF
jgi:hypothetical protein